MARRSHYFTLIETDEILTPANVCEMFHNKVNVDKVCVGSITALKFIFGLHFGLRRYTYQRFKDIIQQSCTFDLRIGEEYMTEISREQFESKVNHVRQMCTDVSVHNVGNEVAQHFKNMEFVRYLKDNDIRSQKKMMFHVAHFAPPHIAEHHTKCASKFPIFAELAQLLKDAETKQFCRDDQTLQEILINAVPHERPGDVDNIIRILRNHNIDEEYFRNTLLNHIFYGNSKCAASKNAIWLIGESNTGKSRIAEALSEILDSAKVLPNSSVFNMAHCLHKELIIIEEFDKFVNIGNHREDFLARLLQNAAKVEVRHGASSVSVLSFRDFVPVLLMGQKEDLNVQDGPSIDNRTIKIYFDGEPFDQQDLFVSGSAMAWFLTQDDPQLTEESIAALLDMPDVDWSQIMKDVSADINNI